MVIEYKMKLELGRQIKQIVHELNAPTASLDKGEMEALELFENHGQDKEIEAVEWRPWQKELFKYVNEPTKRRIIWAVGEKGNEEKSFFQDKIEEQYGRHKVFQMELDETTKDILAYTLKQIYFCLIFLEACVYHVNTMNYLSQSKMEVLQL